MLDPLRSLAELVRTLTRTRSDRRTESNTRTQSAVADESQAHRPAGKIGRSEALRERLRQRIRIVGTQDRRLAREAFVETVLATELGEAVTLDPAMSELVRKVSQQIAADADTDRDLGLLLEELTREPH